MDHLENYFSAVAEIALSLDKENIARACDIISGLRQTGGRMFILGVGGSAGNASHAVNDFRKLCSVDAYAPTDNVSEITARTNDDGWATVFSEWLQVSKLNAEDLLLVFSVGGGNRSKNVSVNLINSIDLAVSRGVKIISIVGKPDGYAAQNSDVSVVVPTAGRDDLVTPLSESFQSVIWHALVSHPKLQANDTKW